jgi:hypothetical protein
LSEPVTLGFGDGSLAGVIRSDAGGLINAAGETVPALNAQVLGDSAGWQATSDDGLDVVLEPLGEPATFPDGTREWLCRARGTAAGAPVDCLGHAVVEAGPPRGWKRVALGRGVSAWLSEELAVALRARRPARARHHEAEDLTGFVLRGSPPAPHPIDEPRLSTAYAGDGGQRRAGLELWETEEADYPLRLAGEAIGAGELELEGGMRLRAAFFVWRYAGQVGAGRYDIVT